MPRVRHRISTGFKFAALEKIVIQIVSLVTFFIVVNNISLRDFGIINLLFTFVTIGTTFVGLGIDRLMIADVAVYRAKEMYGTIRRLFAEYLVLIISTLLVLFIVAWFLKEHTTEFYGVDSSVFYWVLVALIASQVGMNAISIIFVSHEKFAYSFLIMLAEGLVKLVVIVSFFFVFSFSLQTVLWAYVIAKVGAVCLTLPLALLTLKAGQDTAHDENVLLPILRRHGKWEIVKIFLATTTSNISPWIINTFVSTEGVALFAFVQKINSVFVSALPVRSALFPILVNSIQKSRRLALTIITKARKYLFVVYIILYLFMYLYAGYVIREFVPRYAGAENLLHLSMLRLFMYVISLGQSPVLYALKKQKLVFTMSTISIPLMLIAQLIGTYYYGLEGMIIAVLLTTLASGLVREYIIMPWLNDKITRLQYVLFILKSFVTFDEYDKLLLTTIKQKFSLRRNTSAP